MNRWNKKNFIEHNSASLIPENAKFDSTNSTETKPPVYEGEPINCYNLHKLSKEDVVCAYIGSQDTNGERMEFLQFDEVVHNCATDTSSIKIFLKDKDNNEIVINSMFGLYFLIEEDKWKKSTNALYNR